MSGGGREIECQNKNFICFEFLHVAIGGWGDSAVRTRIELLAAYGVGG